MAITAEMWNGARTRVLTRYAEQAADRAEMMRARRVLFPDGADEVERIAAGLDEYAARCRAAASDPSLPTPAYAGSAASRERSGG